MNEGHFEEDSTYTTPNKEYSLRDKNIRHPSRFVQDQHMVKYNRRDIKPDHYDRYLCYKWRHHPRVTFSSKICGEYNSDLVSPERQISGTDPASSNNCSVNFRTFSSSSSNIISQGSSSSSPSKHIRPRSPDGPTNRQFSPEGDDWKRKTESRSKDKYKRMKLETSRHRRSSSSSGSLKSSSGNQTLSSSRRLVISSEKSKSRIISSQSRISGRPLKKKRHSNSPSYRHERTYCAYSRSRSSSRDRHSGSQHRKSVEKRSKDRLQDLGSPRIYNVDWTGDSKDREREVTVLFERSEGDVLKPKKEMECSKKRYGQISKMDHCIIGNGGGDNIPLKEALPNDISKPSLVENEEEEGEIRDNVDSIVVKEEKMTLSIVLKLKHHLKHGWLQNGTTNKSSDAKGELYEDENSLEEGEIRDDNDNDAKKDASNSPDGRIIQELLSQVCDSSMQNASYKECGDFCESDTLGPQATVYVDDSIRQGTSANNGSDQCDTGHLNLDKVLEEHRPVIMTSSGSKIYVADIPLPEWPILDQNSTVSYHQYSDESGLISNNPGPKSDNLMCNLTTSNTAETATDCSYESPGTAIHTVSTEESKSQLTVTDTHDVVAQYAEGQCQDSPEEKRAEDNCAASTKTANQEGVPNCAEHADNTRDAEVIWRPLSHNFHCGESCPQKHLMGHFRPGRMGVRKYIRAKLFLLEKTAEYKQEQVMETQTVENWMKSADEENAVGIPTTSNCKPKEQVYSIESTNEPRSTRSAKRRGDSSLVEVQLDSPVPIEYKRRSKKKKYQQDQVSSVIREVKDAEVSKRNTNKVNSNEGIHLQLSPRLESYREGRTDSVMEEKGHDTTDTLPKYHLGCKSSPQVNSSTELNEKVEYVTMIDPITRGETWQQGSTDPAAQSTNAKDYHDSLKDCQKAATETPTTMTNDGRVQSKDGSSQHIKVADIEVSKHLTEDDSEEDVRIIKVFNPQTICNQQVSAVADVRESIPVPEVSNLLTANIYSSSKEQKPQLQQSESHINIQQRSNTSNIMRTSSASSASQVQRDTTKSKAPTVVPINPSASKPSKLIISKGQSPMVTPADGNVTFSTENNSQNVTLPSNLIFLIPISSQPPPSPGNPLMNLAPKITEPPKTLLVNTPAQISNDNLQSSMCKRAEVQNARDVCLYDRTVRTPMAPPMMPLGTAYSNRILPKIQTTSSVKTLPRRPTPIQNSSRMTTGVDSPITPQPPQHPKTWTFCNLSAFNPVGANQVAGQVVENRKTAASPKDQKVRYPASEGPIDLTARDHPNKVRDAAILRHLLKKEENSASQQKQDCDPHCRKTTVPDETRLLSRPPVPSRAAWCSACEYSKYFDLQSFPVASTTVGCSQGRQREVYKNCVRSPEMSPSTPASVPQFSDGLLTNKMRPQHNVQSSSLSKPPKIKDDTIIWNPNLNFQLPKAKIKDDQVNDGTMSSVTKNDSFQVRYQPPPISPVRAKTFQEPSRESVLKLRQVEEQPACVDLRNNISVSVVTEEIRLEPQTQLGSVNNSYKLQVQEPRQPLPLQPYHQNSSDISLKIPRHHHQLQQPFTFKGVIHPTPIKPTVSACHGHLSRPPIVIPPKTSIVETEDKHLTAVKRLSHLQTLAKLQMQQQQDKLQCDTLNFQSNQCPVPVDFQKGCGIERTRATKSLVPQSNSIQSETTSVPTPTFLKDSDYWMTTVGLASQWDKNYRRQLIDGAAAVRKSTAQCLTEQMPQSPLNVQYSYGHAQQRNELQVKEAKLSHITGTKELMKPYCDDKFPPHHYYNAAGMLNIKNSNLPITKSLPSFLHPHVELGFIPHSSTNF